jgi:hypothetical protein
VGEKQGQSSHSYLALAALFLVAWRFASGNSVCSDTDFSPRDFHGNRVLLNEFYTSVLFIKKPSTDGGYKSISSVRNALASFGPVIVSSVTVSSMVIWKVKKGQHSLSLFTKSLIISRTASLLSNVYVNPL